MENSLNYKHSAFAQEMLSSIRCGKYTAGMRILSERELSERFSVSRNTVREGLAQLFAMNVLERRGRGAFVTSEALRIIESGSANSIVPLPKVWMLLDFLSYENPIYRTIFETIRSGLTNRAVLEVAFCEQLPGAAFDHISCNDIVVLFGNKINQTQLELLARKTRNLLLINAQHEFFNYIVPDNYAAGCAVAEYLYENGHRRIAAALVDPDLPSEFHDRFMGVKDFLRRKKIDLIVEQLDERNSEFLMMKEFVERYQQRKATAIICFKDIQALMIYEIARRKQIALPQELSIVGFDDRCYTANCYPALSTVRYPAEAIGGAALHNILSFIEGKNTETKLKIVPALLKRESVCNLNTK